MIEFPSPAHPHFSREQQHFERQGFERRRFKTVIESQQYQTGTATNFPLWPEKATHRNCPSHLGSPANSPEALRPASQSLGSLRLLVQPSTNAHSSLVTPSISQGQTRPDRNTTALVLDLGTPRRARVIDNLLHLPLVPHRPRDAMNLSTRSGQSNQEHTITMRFRGLLVVGGLRSSALRM